MARRRRRAGTRGDRLRRWLAALVALVALASLAVLADEAWSPAVEEPPDPSEVLVRDLAAAGERTDVIQCVLRLAEDDLRVGPLETWAEQELVIGCRNARDGLDRIAALAMRSTDTDRPSDQPDRLGDDPRLDELWLDCEAGSGHACDLLFEEAPVTSTYEAFGLTCGDRPEVLHCAELDRPDEG